MQKLTNEMIEISKKSKQICTLYDENYVVLNKIMPVTDNDLDNYISAIKDLKKKGVNIATILDYKLIKSSNNKKKNVYTKGFYLEERAKGSSFSSKKIFWINTNEKTDFEEVSIKYMKCLENYIKELENRTEANQTIYDKFLNDYLSFSEVGLLPDPNPTNFFFSQEIGYTIIDPIPGKITERFYTFLASYLFIDVFGHGRPIIFINDNLLNCMSQNAHDRLFKATNKLIGKITYSLRKIDYPNNCIKIAENMINNNLCLDNIKIVNQLDLTDYIKTEFENIKNEQNLEAMKQKTLK